MENSNIEKEASIRNLNSVILIYLENTFN